MTDTEVVTVRTFEPFQDTPVQVSSVDEVQPVSAETVAERVYHSNLAAELAAYKADTLAMQNAIAAAVAAISNNAFPGASELKTAFREISDQSKAQRRMFRAGIKDVAALDDGL